MVLKRRFFCHVASRSRLLAPKAPTNLDREPLGSKKSLAFQDCAETLFFVNCPLKTYLVVLFIALVKLSIRLRFYEVNYIIDGKYCHSQRRQNIEIKLEDELQEFYLVSIFCRRFCVKCFPQHERCFKLRREYSHNHYD